MSQFVSGETALGLVITDEKVMDYFKERYIALNPEEFQILNNDTGKFEIMEKDESKDALDDYFHCCELLTPNDKDNYESFAVKVFNDDTSDGIYFMPAKMGLEYRELRGEQVYFIEAEKLLMTRRILKSSFYESLDEIVEEFRKKVGEYLPDDFDYEACIGDLSHTYYS